MAPSEGARNLRSPMHSGPQGASGSGESGCLRAGYTRPGWRFGDRGFWIANCVRGKRARRCRAPTKSKDRGQTGEHLARAQASQKLQAQDRRPPRRIDYDMGHPKYSR